MYDGARKPCDVNKLATWAALSKKKISWKDINTQPRSLICLRCVDRIYYKHKKNPHFPQKGLEKHAFFVQGRINNFFLLNLFSTVKDWREFIFAVIIEGFLLVLVCARYCLSIRDKTFIRLSSKYYLLCPSCDRVVVSLVFFFFLLFPVALSLSDERRRKCSLMKFLSDFYDIFNISLWRPPGLRLDLVWLCFLFFFGGNCVGFFVKIMPAALNFVFLHRSWSGRSS